MKRLSLSTTFPFGRQKVGTVNLSTGISGKRVSGSPNSNAVKVRRRGKR